MDSIIQDDGYCYFEITSVEEIQNNEPFYCISVDSPTKQFLIGEDRVPTHNTDEGKAIDALKGEAQLLIGSIARLGRAAWVFLAIAFQRPDASMIPGETRDNFGARVGYGTLRRNASTMLFEDMTGTRIQAKPKGRTFIKIYDRGNKGQGFYASPDWIDEWLDKQGLNKDGTPKGSVKQSKLVNTKGVLGDAKTVDELEGNTGASDYIENVANLEDGEFVFETNDDSKQDVSVQSSFVDFNDGFDDIRQEEHIPDVDPLSTWDSELDSIIKEQHEWENRG